MALELIRTSLFCDGRTQQANDANIWKHLASAASFLDIGAVLQVSEWKSVEYASPWHWLSYKEWRYRVYLNSKEALAITWMCEKLSDYFLEKTSSLRLCGLFQQFTDLIKQHPECSRDATSNKEPLMPTPLPENPRQKLGSACPFSTEEDDVPPHGGLFLVQITVLKECYRSWYSLAMWPLKLLSVTTLSTV